jgi:hypothetical protein
MGFLDRIFGAIKKATRGRYKSLDVFLSGKIKPGPDWSVRDQLLRMADEDEKMRNALTAYVKSKEYLNSPFVTKKQ